MMNLNHQSVRVKRLELLEALEANLAVHEEEYATAYADYREAVVAFMVDAAERAQAGDFKDLILKIRAPESRAKHYSEIIDMLEQSVDETIELDRAGFQAYYRNVWSWSDAFTAEAAGYKSLLGSIQGKAR